MTDRHHFHPVVRALHWLMAALILAMLFIGVAMVSTAGPAYTMLIGLHRPIGIALLLLVLIRLAVRLKTGAPALPADLPPPMALAAKASHVLLYLAIIGMPLIGWGMVSAAGYPARLFGAVVLPPLLPHDIALYAVLRTAHTVIAMLFFALILAHLAAGLYHALVRRDGVFDAIWKRR